MVSELVCAGSVLCARAIQAEIVVEFRKRRKVETYVASTCGRTFRTKNFIYLKVVQIILPEENPRKSNVWTIRHFENKICICIVSFLT